MKILSAFLMCVIAITGIILGNFYYNNKIDIQVASAVESQKTEELQEKKENEAKLQETLNSLDVKVLEDIDQVAYKSKVFDKLNNGETATIVFFGDSTTEQNFTTNGKPSHVGVIKNKLTTIYGSNIEVVNAGHSGNDLAALKKRLQTDVIDLEPDMVIMNSSLNDIRLSKGKETFKKEYTDIIKEIQKNTDAEIFLRTSNVTMTPDTNQRLKDELNPITKEIAKEYKLGYVDLYEYYQSLVNKDGIESYNYDNVHPNEKGQQKIADLWLYYLIKSSDLTK